MNLVFLTLTLSTGCKKSSNVESMDDLVDVRVSSDQPGVEVPPHVERMLRNFERVHFAYDSSDLDESSKAALARNAGIMKEYPDLKIEVQGHCDERGTTEYNIALGDRRAAAVRQTLISEGVSPTRIDKVSYGEENPLASGSEEAAWSQNRRAEFRITWTQTGLAQGTVQ
jgi:peptidoglycan-associated lipoprotein